LITTTSRRRKKKNKKKKKKNNVGSAWGPVSGSKKEISKRDRKDSSYSVQQTIGDNTTEY